MMPDQKQTGIAWITGGSAGIGLAIAHSLADAGYLTVLSARNTDLLKASVAAIERAGGKADYVPCDVTNRSEVNSACQTILQRHGKIDVLVNNAGFNVQARTWDDLIPEEFDAVIAANLTGTFNAIHAVLPSMRENASGQIINIGSMAARFVALGGGVAYTAAKLGVASMTELLNQSESKRGIRACLIAPGGVLTRAHDWRPQQVRDTMLKPEDVARAVLYAVESPPHAAVYEVVVHPQHRW
jgi:NADP-dependent 3-hydroxy acid dehydrogenase YdfG